MLRKCLLSYLVSDVLYFFIYGVTNFAASALKFDLRLKIRY